MKAKAIHRIRLRRIGELPVRPLRIVSMLTPQQAGVALRAVEFGRLPPRQVVRWADGAIVADQSPPQWLLDLSLLDSSRFADMLHLLHQHAKRMESGIWMFAF